MAASGGGAGGAHSADSAGNAWDRRPGEPSKWFIRFEVYRQLGAERTMLAAYRLTGNRPDARKVPGSWTRVVEVWEWKKRVWAWDDAQILKAREAEAEQRKRDLEQRFKGLR